MKQITFMGDSLHRLRMFPATVRSAAGHQLYRIELGLDPVDWKPMPTVGPGVREVRIRDAAGAFRILYVASFRDKIVVLHAFSKKTATTAPRNIELARIRLKELQG